MRAAGIIALVLLLASPGAALAQHSPQTIVPAPLPPARKPDVPGGAAHNGVIPPPRVDPGIKIAPPPVRSTMPVIAPPGSPGGNPHVRPK